jgi:threonine dehydratase
MAIKQAPTTALEHWQRGDHAVLLKREDQNCTGSHKDRAARHQVRTYFEQGAKALVLSSSGNGAKASAAAARQFDLPVYAFLSPRTARCKVEAILGYGGQPIVSSRPVNLARYVARCFSIPNLRPSTCDLSVAGFQSLGRELAEEFQESRSFDSVFIFSSSGSSLVAIGRELSNFVDSPTLHPVQAGLLCPLVGDDDMSSRRGQAPRTGALCAKKTARAPEARKWVQALGGRGWIVTDSEVDAAHLELQQSGRFVCREAAAAFSAASRAVKDNVVKRPLVVLTGQGLRNPTACGRDMKAVHRLDDYLETRDYFLKEAQKW